MFSEISFGLRRKMMSDLYKYEDNIHQYDEVKTVLVKKGRIDKPEITIFIPTYKRERTLRETLKSVVMQQTKIPYEVVVVSNDPVDGFTSTRKIIEEFDSERIYYYVNEENIGQCGNWNRGFSLARGKYIVMIHDDDLLSEYAIETISNSIIDNKESGIIGVDYITFSTDNMPRFESPYKWRYKYITKRKFFFENYVNIAGLTIQKKIWEEIGGFSEDYYPAFDSAFIYQAINKSSVINICFPLAGYRKEVNESLSPKTMENIILMKEKIRRNIAKYETGARIWLNWFDKEYLYQYICIANQTWNLSLDYKQIFEIIGFSKKSISRIKYLFMSIIEKVLRRI